MQTFVKWILFQLYFCIFVFLHFNRIFQCDANKEGSAVFLKCASSNLFQWVFLYIISIYLLLRLWVLQCKIMLHVLTVVLSSNVHPQLFSQQPFHISAFHNNSITWRIRVRFEFFTLKIIEKNLMYFLFYLHYVMFHSLCSCLCPRCQIKEEEIGWIDVHTRADLMAVLPLVAQMLK